MSFSLDLHLWLDIFIFHCLGRLRLSSFLCGRCLHLLTTFLSFRFHHCLSALSTSILLPTSHLFSCSLRWSWLLLCFLTKHICGILRHRHSNLSRLHTLLHLCTLMCCHGRIQISDRGSRLLCCHGCVLLLHALLHRMLHHLLALFKMLLHLLFMIPFRLHLKLLMLLKLILRHRRPIIRMDVSRRSPRRQMSLHINRRRIHGRVRIHTVNTRHLPRSRHRIMRRNRNPIRTNHLHHSGIPRLRNGCKIPIRRHGKARYHVGRIGALTPQLLLDGLLRHARRFHRFAEAGGGLHGALLGSAGRAILQREAGRGELLGHGLDVGGRRDAMGVGGAIGPVAVSQCLTRLLNGFPTGELLPRTVESARYLTSSLAFEEAAGWFQGGNVSYDFFGDGFFFGGAVGFAVGGVGAGGDEGAEALVSRVGCDVHAAAGEDIVVSYDNGGFAVLLVGRVAGHVDDDGFVVVFDA
mmetsp:Transcript_1458/g.2565  ORF Transcript_1458/g.2565 Transcript_1458/m.2565 type:complete len:466 (+) Transcript_1458:255-1652(+)